MQAGCGLQESHRRSAPLLGNRSRLCHNSAQQNCCVRGTDHGLRLQPKPGGPMSSVRVLATDLAFPEGPVVMPDGSVILVEIRAQQLTRVWPDGRKEVDPKIPGGPKGAAIGPDSKCYISNNGGFLCVGPARPLRPPPRH